MVAIESNKLFGIIYLILILGLANLSNEKTWIFEQDTGKFSEKLSNGTIRELCVGYSGDYKYINNPKYQNTHGGPLPQGAWYISFNKEILDDDYMAHVSVLAPLSVPTCERSDCNRGCDSFRIHGDSLSRPLHGSLGCVIIPLFIRKNIMANDILLYLSIISSTVREVSSHKNKKHSVLRGSLDVFSIHACFIYSTHSLSNRETNNKSTRTSMTRIRDKIAHVS